MRNVQYSLVGGFNHLEKYESQGKDYPIYKMENKKCLKPPTSSSMCSTTSKETPPKMAPLVPTGSTACNRGTSLRPVGEKAWIKTNLQRTRRLLPQVLVKMTYKKNNVFLGKSKVPRVMHQISTLDHRAWQPNHDQWDSMGPQQTEPVEIPEIWPFFCKKKPCVNGSIVAITLGLSVSVHQKTQLYLCRCAQL